MTNQPFSLEELSKEGQKFYIEQLKEPLEKKAMGQFVVIDVQQKKYVVDSDRLAAVEKAKKDFGDKLFYIMQIGNIQNPGINFSEKYAWNF